MIPAAADTAGLNGVYVYKATYRRDGVVATATLPAGAVSGERVEYGYTASGEPSTTIGQSLDSAGNITTTRRYVDATTYDTLGRVTGRRLGDPAVTGKTNVQRGYGYDILGRLSTLTATVQWASGSATSIQDDQYGYQTQNRVELVEGGEVVAEVGGERFVVVGEGIDACGEVVGDALEGACPGSGAGRMVARVSEVGALSLPVLDSSPAVNARVLASWRAMSARDRLDQVAALNELCERLSEAGVRARYPSAGEGECRLRVLALRLGRELMIDVYGWDPAVEGW